MCSPVGETMGRGRKPILSDRTTTCVNLDGKHKKYLQTHNIELSSFVRDTIDVLIQSEESPIEQLKREIEEIKEIIQENQIKLAQRETRLHELEAKQETEKEEEVKANEFEMKRRDYVRDCKRMMQTQQTCNRFWMEHLTENWKFTTFDEAKTYVRDIWLDEGVPDKRIKTFLRLN